MPRYLYIAKSLKGEAKSGIMEASDEHHLAKILRQEGYLLTSVSIEESEKKKFSFSLSFSRGVSLTEKMLFTRNLQIMIAAGIALPKALTILSNQMKSKKMKNALIEVENEVIKGNSFADSLAKHHNIFSKFFTSIIKVGEASGTLEEGLKVLTRQMERENDLRSKIIGAMVYPAVIISAMIGVGILMLVMVIPKLAETFADLNVQLPATTRFIIFLGTFLATKGYLVILLVVGLVFLLRRIAKTKGGKRFIDSISLKAPIISPIIKQMNSAHAIRTLSSLIASGVPIIEALDIVASTMGNIYFQNSIIDAMEKVKKGIKLSEALKPYEKLYSSLVIQMIQVGEETGETSGILLKLADFFEEEVTNATKNLSSIIEPILMLIIGGVVGFFAVSMFQPIYSMLGSMQ
jgi:type IV pilus assembly protein PilC